MGAGWGSLSESTYHSTGRGGEGAGGHVWKIMYNTINDKMQLT